MCSWAWVQPEVALGAPVCDCRSAMAFALEPGAAPQEPLPRPLEGGPHPHFSAVAWSDKLLCDLEGRFGSRY